MQDQEITCKYELPQCWNPPSVVFGELLLVKCADYGDADADEYIQSAMAFGPNALVARNLASNASMSILPLPRMSSLGKSICLAWKIV